MSRTWTSRILRLDANALLAKAIATDRLLEVEVAQNDPFEIVDQKSAAVCGATRVRSTRAEAEQGRERRTFIDGQEHASRRRERDTCNVLEVLEWQRGRGVPASKQRIERG